MSTPTAGEQEVWDRLWAAERLPRGRAQIAALEDGLREADALGSPELRFGARIFLTSAYQQGGEPAKAFVPFAWCLAVHDRGEADPRWTHDLHWYFKFMAGSMATFPEVPLDRTRAVLDDMERRYRAAGYTMNPVHQYRAVLARHVGDRETAAEQYRLWSAAPRGQMSDCVGCEPSDKVAHLSWLGRYAEAAEVAEPVLGGQFSCVEQPQHILTELLLPYVHIGRYDDAVQAYRRAYRAMRHDPAQLQSIATHLAFCALTGNHARGLDLVERHLGWLDAPPTPYAEQEFAAAAALNLRLVAEGGHGDAPVRRAGGMTTVAALRDELADRALAIAARFDARNGTAEQSDRVRAMLAAEPLVEHLPLSGTAAPAPVPAPAQVYPDSPEELADLGEQEARLGRSPDAVWARFDEVCPEPSGALRARRLTAAADAEVPGDLEAASHGFAHAAGLFEEAGDAVGAEAARGKGILFSALAGDRPDAPAELEASAARIAEIGEPAEHARALLRLAMLHFARQDLEATAEVLDRAGDPVRATPELTGAWLERRALVLANQGDLPGAIELVASAAARYTEAGSPERTANARLLGVRFRAGLGDRQAAFAEATSIDPGTSRSTRAQLQQVRGHLANDLGRPEDAATAFRAAVGDFAALGAEVDAAVTRVELAAASLDAGRPEDAAEAIEDAEAVLERASAGHELARGRYLLARACQELDREVQAVELFAASAGQFAEMGNEAAAGQATESRAEVLDGLDRDAEAAEGFAAAAERFKTAELPAEELRNRRRAALSWLWAGEPARAEEALVAADAVTGEGPQFEWERALAAYDGARLLANLDRPAEALPRATAAAEALRAMEAEGPAVAADVLSGRLWRDLGKVTEAREVLTAALARLPEEAAGQRADIENLLAELDT
ncbi:tetratricopeptide (TPR) repeat protein [Amycolatopsis lexingtonensis]|uniref:Tetratricopeptide (TPR) repeat protein n=1 Tax=Amycolatopsis lexingtonensis TaxID=218822 RepID=A0ABR9HZY7_9PSEU|nr:hypothetical protein [Amycolatopsis lexingtonensis]MBE1496514.1 tetratricopeptide (TPR) repeat protein [Amycolatopsis lexingtonensis]